MYRRGALVHLPLYSSRGLDAVLRERVWGGGGQWRGGGAVAMSTSKISLVIKSFERQIAENAAGFVMQYTRQMGVKASLVRLPTKTKRFSLLKSPFKYHKHFEAFQV